MKPLNYIKAIHSHLRVRRLERRGIRVPQHVVVFESDDWGSIRMPSLATRESLITKGVMLQSPNTYDYVDTLASERDLMALMETLDSVRDSKGNPAVITLDTIVANPNFERIKESGFNQYFYEPFTETLKRYPHHGNSFSLWKEGMDKKLFRPQFHGREHLNVQLWLKCLKAGDSSALFAFEEGCFSMKCLINGRMQRVLEAYNAQTAEEYAFMQQSIKEGLVLFEKIFGYRSESMIAPCYTWDEPIEKAAMDCGVKYLQGNVLNSHSFYYSQSSPHQTPRIMGKRNLFGQVHLVRNCLFEPTQVSKYNKDRCLRDISRQFRLHHPAIVSCHRLNFIGDLVPENRDKNLKEFKELLKTIIKVWPDVEFMSSDQLGAYLESYGEA